MWADNGDVCVQQPHATLVCMCTHAACVCSFLVVISAVHVWLVSVSSCAWTPELFEHVKASFEKTRKVRGRGNGSVGQVPFAQKRT